MNTNASSCIEKDGRDLLVKEIIAKHKNVKGSLIPILHEVQGLYGYLPAEVQAKIAKEMNVPMAEVFGVISFYSAFALNPKGRFKIALCMGTACYVKGSGPILDKLKEQLNIGMGETTDDGEFTLEECRCLGACGLAPVLTINGKVFGRLTKEDVDGIIAECKSDEEGIM
ncbi:MAG: NAD(P)H-dependent oxidoreductase subunit E [Acetobacterium sp.]